MQVHVFDCDDWPKEHPRIRDDIRAVIIRAYDDASVVVTYIPEHVNICVQPNKYEAIPEYGVGGYTVNSEFVTIYFDEAMPYGYDTFLRNVYAAVVHELNHTARWSIVKYDDSVYEHVMFEGLATVFEREYGKNDTPLYAVKEANEKMKKWFDEMIDAYPSINWNKTYKFRHTDGRRWILYKTGVWIVDRAMERSGKTISDLTKSPAAEIVKLAQINTKEEVA